MTNRERELYLEYMRQHPWARASYALALVQALAYAEERKMELPKCAACNKGILLPLSDYGPEGSSVKWKAWVCSSKTCGFAVRIDKGQVAYDHANSTPIKKTY